MFELIDVFVGLGFAGVGYLAGRSHRKHAQPRRYEDPKPICGCGHHMSYHNNDGCHWQLWDEYEERTETCACKQYIGPTPLPEIIP
jgi:hypothetical protein